MIILITGTSSGIGLATAEFFLQKGHDVIGLDVEPSSIDHASYTHYIADVRCPETFPEICPEVLVNNAGVQESGFDIDINLKGVINITEHYAIDNPNLKAVVNVSSASAITGSEFPEYAASKGGLTAYTKNVAMRIAPRAVCNSICPGGVITDLNNAVMNDEVLWSQIMDLTPLKRWATTEEIAEWIYFLSINNRFMTGQNLLIDGGEAGNMHFVWPE